MMGASDHVNHKLKVNCYIIKIPFFLIASFNHEMHIINDHHIKWIFLFSLKQVLWSMSAFVCVCVCECKTEWLCVWKKINDLSTPKRERGLQPRAISRGQCITYLPLVMPVKNNSTLVLFETLTDITFLVLIKLNPDHRHGKRKQGT